MVKKSNPRPTGKKPKAPPKPPEKTYVPIGTVSSDVDGYKRKHPRKNYTIKIEPVALVPEEINSALKFDPSMFWLGVAIGIITVGILMSIHG